MPELGWHLEPPPHVALAPTEDGRVDRQHQRLVAGVGAAVDHLLDQAAITPGIHLEPPAPVADRRDLLDGPGGERRQRVGQAGPGCGPGRRQLTLRVGDAGEPDGRQHERDRDRPAQHGGRRIDLPDRTQDAWSELQASEGCAVVDERPLVLGAAVDVVEHAAREPPLGDPPQVGHRRRRRQAATWSGRARSAGTACTDRSVSNTADHSVAADELGGPGLEFETVATQIGG